MSRNRYNRRPARCDRPLGEATLLSLQLFGEATLLSLPALAKPSSEAARVPLPRWGEASRRAATGGPRSVAADHFAAGFASGFFAAGFASPFFAAGLAAGFFAAGFASPFLASAFFASVLAAGL